MGDFTSEPMKQTMSNYMELYDPKNPENLSYIDLFLTNKNIRFLDTNVFETGSSNFHKLVVTVLF